MTPRHFTWTAVLLVACGAAQPPRSDSVSPDDDRPRLALGGSHSCVLARDGGVLCWGANDRGQLGNTRGRLHTVPGPVAGVEGITQIAAGRAHTCGLHEQGHVLCWGAGLRGQLGDGGEGEAHQSVEEPARVRGLDDIVQVVAGDHHTCALGRDQTVHCWGDDAAGQLGDGPPATGRSAVPVTLDLQGIQQIAAGEQHTCALNQAGTAFCWGYGAEGQLGHAGDAEASSFPQEVVGAPAFAELAAGRAHTCGRTAQGRVHCWGSDERGQRGDGSGAEVERGPTEVSEIFDAVSLAAGAEHTCARRASHEIWCWGANERGQLGDGTLADALRPVPSGAAGVEVAAGVRHTCARQAWGAVVCWGDNARGQLGDGRIARRSEPALAVRGALGLAAGGHHTCVLHASSAVCWGDNGSGQLGEVVAHATSTPVPAIFAPSPQELTLALGRTCMRDREGRVLCAGDGAEPSGSQRVVSLGDLGTVAQVAVAHDFACALNAEGAIACWGENGRGQLGDGTLQTRDAATRVEGAGDAREIAVGTAHACARLVSGAVFCWGANERGQLGDGSQEDRSVPTRVTGLDDAVSLALGRSHSCARRGDGSVSCWGANTFGQLGDGTTTSRPTAGPVRSLRDVEALAAGWLHTCARTSDHRVSCWGENRYGQLGRETEETFAASPGAVDGLEGADDVAAGGLHTCARLESGEVHCWGANDYGQLGDRVTLVATRPVVALAP